MSEVPAPDGVQVLDQAQAEELLKTQNLGRIALVVDGRPELFPVNYAFDEGVLVFRTAAGLKLERGPMTAAAFEVDMVDAAAGVAWSVVVKGTVHDITEALDPLPERLRHLTVTPQAPGDRPAFMAIYAKSITGRRFPIPRPGEAPWIGPH